MSEIDIFVKTDAGAEEIKARSRRLPPRLRTMLIMVDGTLSTSQLKDAAATLGAPGNFLQALEEQGLIRRREAAAAAERTVDLDLGQAGATRAARAQPVAPDFNARCRAAVRELNDALGPSAESLAIRMERARDAAELRPLLQQAAQVIGNARGRATAEAYAARHDL